MTEEEINFRMPRPDTGSAVKIFPNGRSDERPHFAFVAKVQDRSIDVKDPFNMARGGVRHVSDPMLQRSEELRKQYGAWDFTDEAKSVRENADRLAALEKRIKSLEELLDKKTK